MTLVKKASFFSRIKAWLKKVLGSAPAWEHTASETLTFAAPLAETIVGLTAGEPAAAAIASVVAKIQTGLAAAAVTIEGAGPSPTLTSTLNSVKENITTLLTAGQIKDAATQAKVQAIADTLFEEIEAIEQEFSTSTTGAPVASVPAPPTTQQ
jgi:hypothetical protein